VKTSCFQVKPHLARSKLQLSLFKLPSSWFSHILYSRSTCRIKHCFLIACSNSTLSFTICAKVLRCINWCLLV